MKRALTSLLGIIAVLTAFSACRMTQEQEQESGKTEAGKVYPVHFVAAEIESRTVFGEAVTTGGGTTYPTLWSTNDSQVAVSLNLNPAKGADVTPAEDFTTATFDAGFTQSEVSAPYTFYALTPYSAYVGASSDHGGYHFHIPTEQTPLAASCDERAQVMAASQTVSKIADFNSVEMHFNHLTAYGKMTLRNVSLPEGAEILSIDLTASEPFAGQFYYDFESGTLEAGSPSRTVTIDPANISFNEGTSTDIWFACAPADLGGGTLKVDMNTSAGILSRTVELGEGKLAFRRGHVSKFGINMADAVFTENPDRWVLVTDASTLAAGDEIIIANSASAGAAYALSTTQNEDNRGRVAVSIDQDTDGKMIVQNPGTTVEVLTLVAGAYPGYFYLKETTTATGRYLGTTGDSYGNSNYLRSNEVSTATDDSHKGYHNWTFSIASAGVAYITAYQSVRSGWSQSYKHLRHSNSSQCFSAYMYSSRTSWSGNNSQSVYVYRRESGVNVHDDPILEQDAYGAYLSGGNRVFSAGDQLSREYIGNGTVTFAILTPAAYEVAEFNGIPVNPVKGDSFTLNYNLISGRNQSDTDYSVTVVKVDGPRVWLSTGDGYGFIVKK